MGKSYWMEDQQGNFTNNKEDAFDPKKRIIGKRLQQGVPLLDRDWNELEDIRRYEEQMLRKYYIGNGTPDDGFKIIAAKSPDNINNFKIGEGRCLVDGFEVVNEPPEQKQFINYTDQNLVEPLAPPINEQERIDTVYLDVWIKEVRSLKSASEEEKKDPERIDESLGNTKDVDIETCVGHRLVWRVRVDEGSEREYKKSEYHHYYDIARINREKGKQEILDTDITDLRNVNGKEAFVTKNNFNDIINSILKGNLPSISETKLVTISDILSPHHFVLKDRNGNVWLFWDTDEGGVKNFWCKTYKAGNWGSDTKLTTDTLQKEYINHFEDNNGNVWFLWLTSGESTNFWCVSCTSGYIGQTIKLTTDVIPDKTIFTKQFFEDHNGNLLFFWFSTTEDGVTNFWCKRYKNGYWEDKEWIETVNLRSPTILKILEDDGNIWFFWSTEINNETEKIWCKRYKDGRWEKDSKLVTDSLVYIDLFKDHNGNILLFGSFAHHKDIFKSLRCIDGDNWGKLQSVPGREDESNNYIGFFEDLNGNVCLFWRNDNEILCATYYEKDDTWGAQLRLTPDFTNVEYLKLFGDRNGKIWLFWKGTKNEQENVWCERMHYDRDSRKFELEEAIALEAESIQDLNIFEDYDGDLLLLWSTGIRDGLREYWYERVYSTEEWYNCGTKTKLTTGIPDGKEYYFLNGDIWLLFSTPEYGNIWCKRYMDGDWMTEMRLISGKTKKQSHHYVSFFEDNDGNILLFWIETQDSTNISNLMFKKLYNSI